MLLPPAYLHAHPSGPPTGDALIFTFDIASGGDDVEIETENVGVFNAVIDWGDGQQDTITSHNDPALLHVYANPGIYTCEITGSFPSFKFGEGVSPARRARVRSLEQWGDVGFLALPFMFTDCPNVVINATDVPDMSNVTSLRSAFEETPSITDIPGIENWNVSSVTNLNSTFKLMSATISKKLNWNTPNNETLNQFCRNSPGIDFDVSSFDVTNVTTADNFMEGSGFSDANYDLLLAAWAPQNVQSGVTLDLSHARWTDDANRDLLISKGWALNDLCHVDDYCVEILQSAGQDFTVLTANRLGYDATIDWGDGSPKEVIDQPNTSYVHTYTSAGTYGLAISGAFPDLNTFFWTKSNIRDLRNWGNLGVMYADNMYRDCSNFNTNMRDQIDIFGYISFLNCSSLDSDGSDMDPTPAGNGNIGAAFKNCNKIRLNNARGWDLSGASAYNNSFLELFNGCVALEVDPYDWVAAPVGSANGLFQSCSLFDGNLINWDFSGVTDFGNAFYNCVSLSTANVDNFLEALYRERMNFGWASPSVDLSWSAPPSGVEPPEYNNPPLTGTDFIYWLENDPEGEGFSTWSITY